MAFNEIQLKQIEKAVGGMCRRRSPDEFRNELRTIYTVKGHDVTVYEERPRWDKRDEWSSMPVAKFKYVKKDNVWRLYWMRSDLKWHAYEPSSDSKSLEELVREVDRDPHGAFFG